MANPQQGTIDSVSKIYQTEEQMQYAVPVLFSFVIPASQSAASMTAVFTSLRVRQASGKVCVLQRATSATVRCGAAATVVVHLLDASQSPPGQ
jgi:hypothetical protein